MNRIPIAIPYTEVVSGDVLITVETELTAEQLVDAISRGQVDPFEHAVGDEEWTTTECLMNEQEISYEEARITYG